MGGINLSSSRVAARSQTHVWASLLATRVGRPSTKPSTRPGSKFCGFVSSADCLREAYTLTLDAQSMRSRSGARGPGPVAPPARLRANPA